MKRFFGMFVILALVLLQAEISWAEMYVVGSASSGVTTVVRSLPAPQTETHKMKITVRGGAISWFANGSTPTASDGNQLSDGGEIELECRDEMTKFRAVLSSGETGVTLLGGETGVTLYTHELGNR